MTSTAEMAELFCELLDALPPGECHLRAERSLSRPALAADVEATSATA